MGRSITFIGFIKPRRRRPAATKRAFDAMMTMKKIFVCDQGSAPQLSVRGKEVHDGRHGHQADVSVLPTKEESGGAVRLRRGGRRIPACHLT
jgi:hypothetical protein